MATTDPSPNARSRSRWITALAVIVLLVAGNVAAWVLIADDDTTCTSAPAPTTDPAEPRPDADTVEVCDVITEIDDAAFDIYRYDPVLHDVEELDEAVAVLDEHRDVVDDDLGDAMDVLVDYTDILRTATAYSDVPPEAKDAYDLVLDYYTSC